MEKTARLIILIVGLFFAVFAFAKDGLQCPKVSDLGKTVFYKKTDFTQEGAHYSGVAWSDNNLPNHFKELTVFFNPHKGAMPLIEANSIIANLKPGDVQGPFSNSWGPYHWHFCVYGGIGNPNHFVLVHTQGIMIK